MRYYELKDDGYTEFGVADTGGGYDWNEFRVWLKDGVFWWAADAGCSCNSYGDSLDFPDDFDGHGTAHDVIRALMNWKTHYSEVDSLLNELLNYRDA